MDRFLCILLLLLFFSCKGQNNKSEKKIMDTTYTLSKQKIMQDENKTFLELYIAEYVDSINNSSKEIELPQFLCDPQFDYKKSGIWESPHNPISVRGEIINRVSNCKSLQLIINSKNEGFRTKPHIEDNLTPPLIELSFFDLAFKRIKALNCK